MFAVNGLTALAIFMLALFLALFAWIALSFTSGLAGFCSMLAGGGCRLGTGPDAPLPQLAARTALLMPTYNEQPARIMAGLQAMWESLRETGAADAFDLFILSDTTDPADLDRRGGRVPGTSRADRGMTHRIFYRRRPRNVARKSGNIAEWVTRFGGAYAQFLILDADSLMTGETLVRLAGAMERHPDVGLIQTLPIITGAATLFARVQQFAGRVYGPLIAHGIAWWHGAEGNYWGHNAMIRTRAFAEQAGLPELAGRKPFGGPIMSHDFVEAALMRRGGWAVHMVPGVRGSYEEVPPTLTDLAVRDRRWCQGNLQHAGGAADPRAARDQPAASADRHRFLHHRAAVAAVHPHRHPDRGAGALRAAGLFPAGQVAVPAVAGDRSGPRHVDVRRHHGAAAGAEAARLRGDPAAPDASGAASAGRCGCSAASLFETLVAGLIAPVVMLTQTIDVVAILLGRDSGWNAQRRDDGAVPARETRRLYRRHTVLGLLLGAVAWAVSLSLALWMLPVVLGLALAIPLALLTGRRWSGAACCARPRTGSRRRWSRGRWRCNANGRRRARPTWRGCCASRGCWRRTWRCCRRRGVRASIRSMPRWCSRGQSWRRRTHWRPPLRRCRRPNWPPRWATPPRCDVCRRWRMWGEVSVLWRTAMGFAFALPILRNSGTATAHMA